MKQTLTEVLFADDTTLFRLDKNAELYKKQYQESIDLFGQTENLAKEERMVIRHRAEVREYQVREEFDEKTEKVKANQLEK